MMPTLRTFVGVPISPALVRQISGVRTEFRDRTIHWVPEPKLHLTLKFLGEVEESQIVSIRTALRNALLEIKGFHVTARGLGVFPGNRRPRVLWVRLTAPELTLVARQLSSAVEPFGIEGTTKGFHPHATIGRWRSAVHRGRWLQSEMETWKDRKFGDFPIDEVTLFQSTLRPTGAIYSVLEVFPLKRIGNHPVRTEKQKPEVSKTH